MENINPLVTIVTPSFNQGRFIEETILSVLNQTYRNIQYIIVDGGSNDNSMQVINRYRDRIDIVIHEKDEGQSDAINKGFKLAKGELVGWINSDDLLYPDCVEAIVDLYKEKRDGVIFYHSINDLIDINGLCIRTSQHIISDRKYLLKKNYNVPQPGSFYKLDIIKEVNYIDVTIYYCMDLDLWLRLLLFGPIYYTKDHAHTGFRFYSGTKTDTGKDKFLKNIYFVLMKHGAKFYYPTIWNRIFIYRLKAYVKRLLSK